MRAFVRLRPPAGPAVELGHGDLIGRLVTASLCIDDPRVSEAHALVSVRRGELVMLSLRRMLSVRGKPVNEAILMPGMAVELADGLSLYVEEVVRPEGVLALEAEGLGRHALPGIVSLHEGPPPHLAPRFDADAALHVWWNGEGWRARTRGGKTDDIEPGSHLRVGSLAVRFVLVAPHGGVTTPRGAPALEAPLRIIAWYDSVEIHREGRVPLTLGGVGARILSELAVLNGPVEWHVVAREVWSEEVESAELRHRWDVTLARVRARLKTAGIRRDLFRSDGSGLVQLVRFPSDVVEDRT
jgi:hypothetical protein